ncbi:MAG: glycogen debranching protein [Cytophagia bacterium]|nr:glycogen debranching protein [Cytophagia bacterium]
MKKLLFSLLVSCCLLFSCEKRQPTSVFAAIVPEYQGIAGKAEYLASPYLTPGDKTYMVGHQNGSFPDLGWHVTGEMGGIWNHPIKLMDGFIGSVTSTGATYCLNNADQFINYPFFNEHKFQVKSLNLNVSRKQFVPDGEEAVYVEYLLTNTGEEDLSFEFSFNGMVDIQPVWLGERTNMVDGEDTASFNKQTGRVEAKDSDNEWHVVYGSTSFPSKFQINDESCDFERSGKGVNASLTFPLKLKEGEQIVLPFIISGSSKSLEEANATFDQVKDNVVSLVEWKAKRYREINQTASLNTPDDKLNQAFLWTKYNTDWLINEVEGLGRGITAGNPDYPWFFGADSEYALQGAIAVGMKDMVYSTIHLIDSVSNTVNNGSGKIMHEMSTNGAVFNPGNLNETPQFATLIWEVFKWTGDMDFLRKYYPTVVAGLDWLLEENDEDGNLLADGYGMMEIHGLESEMIDVASYTYKAFMDAAEMAEVLGQPAEAKDYRMKATQLAQIINKDFWVGEFNSYADFIGTASDAKHLIEGAIVRADTLEKPWAVLELKATQKKVNAYPPSKKQGFVLYHNWVVNTPMEVGVAEPEKAIKALNTGSKYVNPFGIFVTGIDRDETAGSDDSGFAKKMKIFSYTGAVMTLPTGVQAIAENNYGRPDNALDYLQRMTNSFSYALPGSIYEVSPDFGMHTQAWNIYSYAVPMIKQFFGVNPMAHENKVIIQPLMPSDWNEASLENVVIGGNSISIEYSRTEVGERLKITQADASFQVAFTITDHDVEVIAGNEVNRNDIELVLDGANIEVLLKSTN